MAAKGFWDSPNLEPKRNFKWLLLLGDLNPNIPQWVVKSANKPNYTIGETVHKFLNHSFYFPGRLEWQTIDVTTVDPVSPNVAGGIVDYIRNAGYQYPDVAQAGGPSPDASETQGPYSAMTKSRATLGDVVLTQIGNDETDPVEKWRLRNAWVKDVKFGDLSYDNEDMTEVTLTLRYDWAELENLGL